MIEAGLDSTHKAAYIVLLRGNSCFARIAELGQLFMAFL